MLPPPSSLLPPLLLQVGIQLCIAFTVLVFWFFCMYLHVKLSDNTAAAELPSGDAAAANNGLKKKVLKYLPKLTYAANNDNLSDCAICLAEFATGDELRVLPQCGEVPSEADLRRQLRHPLRLRNLPGRVRHRR
ncbi:unnamed protein product [Fraxinus pennsylvanica]|uniref:Uncharacterized protein n=1 Tax=Fraxinus pennsylvanica TaxID=56036 RepID=A0AAD2A1C6_9LAMI|nr:unnamed protein product [Fraxinus pennsylvanica]